MLRGLRIHASGIVQGVGFRPFVYGLATNLKLKGWVRNSSSGVDIELCGADDALETFMFELTNHPPKLARIDNITSYEILDSNLQDFKIIESKPETGNFLPISPDVAICEDCARELLDPTDRRYRYPFINCTNCGPRFTIIHDIPYDRPNTTMSSFPTCANCAEEYHDPLNRRFHAQPTACANCGPRVEYFENPDLSVFGEEAIQSARQSLKDGKILAIKGLGGFHLACDAHNSDAVSRLHIRKNRSDKPFALMTSSIQSMLKYVFIDPEEEGLLLSPQHPVVLVKKRSNELNHTASRQESLGFMLPYTPLHVLLCEDSPGYPDVLVMTSGNISEEPISFLDDEALNHLSGIADGFLTHNREIHTRVDDSVIRIFEKKVYPLRRARGFAPDPIQFPATIPPILACGAELKNTFALSKESYIFISHHIGDLQNYETLRSFEEGISHYKSLFRITPQAVAVDLHPDYLSTKYGLDLSCKSNLPLVQVQHHHAHLAACLADNSWNSEEPVIGLIFDGTGFGTDGNIWGGEVLIGGYNGFHRKFHLQETLLPGGDSAIRNAAKIAFSQVQAAGIDLDNDLPFLNVLTDIERSTIRSQIDHHINTPVTTSMGRLFDAVSSILGVCHRSTYEGQAAIELENCSDPDETGFYPIQIYQNEIMSFDLISQIIEDFRKNVPISNIAARFHNSICHICLNSCKLIREESGIKSVALSGGVWQNMTLLGKTVPLLRESGFKVMIHRQVPTNDGGLSLGQILVAASKMKE